MHLSEEAVDTVADYLSIFVLIFVPALLIYLFWMVHILPEKIAHKRHHPQADALANVPTEFWKFGADMLARLFTGGALKAQIEVATAEQQAALALYGQTVLRAFSEVETSLANEQLLVDQQRYLESVLTQDNDAVRLGRLRYTAGATDLLHVLQLQAKQINTRFDLIGIQNDRLTNRVGLHLALGGGFEPPPTP